MGLAVTSDVQRPPTQLARMLEVRAPGIWQAFRAGVEALDRTTQGTVTSWWRSPERNAAVGGSSSSQHLLGVAIDVTGDLQRIAHAARAAGWVVVVESDHVHLQAFPAGALARAGIFRAAFG